MICWSAHPLRMIAEIGVTNTIHFSHTLNPSVAEFIFGWGCFCGPRVDSACIFTSKLAPNIGSVPVPIPAACI